MGSGKDFLQLWFPFSCLLTGTVILRTRLRFHNSIPSLRFTFKCHQFWDLVNTQALGRPSYSVYGIHQMSVSKFNLYLSPPLLSLLCFACSFVKISLCFNRLLEIVPRDAIGDSSWVGFARVHFCSTPTEGSTALLAPPAWAAAVVTGISFCKA